MSELINYTPQPDHFGDVCKQINEARSGILHSIATNLEACIDLVNNNANLTRAELYAGLGDQGAKVLQFLGVFRGILQTQAPDLLSEKIADAGSGLVVNNDGTVTVP